MSFQLNLPPSEIGRLARSEQSAGGGERQKQSREDWKKMKELEEARKAGTAPAMQDEEGKWVPFNTFCQIQPFHCHACGAVTQKTTTKGAKVEIIKAFFCPFAWAGETISIKM